MSTTRLCAGCSAPVGEGIWHEGRAYHERCLPAVPLATAFGVFGDPDTHGRYAQSVTRAATMPGRQRTAPKMLRSKFDLPERR